MKIHVLVLAVLFALSPLAFAAGGDSSAPAKAVDPDYIKAEKAIQAKDWAPAVTLLTQVVARDGKNADAYNYLGFAERNQGNLDAAFKHYDRALAIDPKHRGVREYLGEAYLLSNNLPKAEEQLAALNKLCTFSCSEYRELKERIGDYKQKQLATNKTN